MEHFFSSVRTPFSYVLPTVHVLVAVLFLGVAVGATAMVVDAQDEIYPGVTVGGVNVSGMSRSQAEVAITTRVEDLEKELRVTFSTQEFRTTATLSDIGIQIQTQESVDAAWNAGRSEPFYYSVVAALVGRVGASQNLSYVIGVDQQTQTEYWEMLSSRVDDPASEHTLRIVDQRLLAQEGSPWTTVNLEGVSERVLAAVANGDSEITISLPLVEQTPRLSFSQVREIAQEAQRVLDQEITLQENDRTWVISKDQLAAWLVFQPLEAGQVGNLVYELSEDGQPTLAVNVDALAIQRYLVDIGGEVNVSPTPELTQEAKERTQVLQAGSDGHALNIPDTQRRIVQAMLESGDRNVGLVMDDIPRPKIAQENPESPMTDGKVIAVDLTHQTAYGYENGELLYFARTSTGRPPYYTKTGEFAVYTKTRRQTMSGPGYSLPNVQWSMFYDGDYALHGTYWHNNFGTPMSHGCTNLTNEDAQWFWEWAPVGTTVVIYGETPRV